jgi:hypothetical protein
MYPKFEVADDNRWGRVLRQALSGDSNALEAIDYRGNPEDHAVCAAVLKAVNSTAKGKTVRKQFTSAPHGWPQDAVDASLTVLTLTNHVQARQNGQSVDATDLTQRSIGTARFRAETVTLSQRQIIQIRGFLDSLVDVAAGDEAQAVRPFLQAVRNLADRISGPAPLPAPPDLSYVDEVERCSGNEQLAKLFEHKNRFIEDVNEWQSKSNRLGRRQAEWSQLQTALRQAAELDGVQDLREQVQAIKENRSLLAANDPVQPLLSRATDLLRDAVTARHTAYREAYEEQLANLEASEPWQALTDGQQSAILAQHDLDDVPNIEVGTTEELLDALNETPLDSWDARLDALPQRFDNALSAAVRELEPDTVRVQLDSRVLKTKDDVEDWIESARKRLLNEVQSHPVQV